MGKTLDAPDFFDVNNFTEVAKGIFLNSWINEELSKKLDISLLNINFFNETPYHFHKNTQELFRFYGDGKVILDGKEFEVKENSTIYIPKEVKHKLIPVHTFLATTLITRPRFDPSDEYLVDTP